MIQPKFLFDLLNKYNINSYFGVPDSLLKYFCAFIQDNSRNHIACANEGNAIALASGHYLATANIACCYMQNSGLGNSINPLVSLVDEEVYNIPVLMIIGLRGEVGIKDEPQHIKQGKITGKLLDTMNIRYELLPQDENSLINSVKNAVEYMNSTKKSFAFLVKKNTFANYESNELKTPYNLTQKEAMSILLKKINDSDVIVSTTGYLSRVLYQIRQESNQSHKQDFLTVGSMGHASSIALGIAINKPDRNVFCFDGDGAFLMHQGACIVNASLHLKNFKHIVFNNEAYDSTGAQPTSIKCADISKIASYSGYNEIYSVSNKSELENILDKFISNKCTSFLEIKIRCGVEENLLRPKEHPKENKAIFMEHLSQIEYCYKGAIEKLEYILQPYKNILIFTGNKSFESVSEFINKYTKNLNTYYYNDFSVNPNEEDIIKAIEKIDYTYDIILAIGGGSVMDFAKIYRYYKKDKTKLVAIPTTFGTGAESTQFGVIYKNGIKLSIEDKAILPDYAIVDATFAKTSTKYLKAVTAMDAYCQAIESYWSILSNDISKKYAMEAIKLCKENIVDYVNSNNENYACNMALASHLAGKAINISRTTAAHALSYKISSEYCIPHGHAVAMTIAKLFEVNAKCQNISDSRGEEYFKTIMNDLKKIISECPINYFKDLYSKIGLSLFNIQNKKLIVDSVNQQRLKNNPVILNEELLYYLLEQ